MDNTQTQTRLTYQLCFQQDLLTPQVDRMYQLMEANYDLVDYPQFYSDLVEKQWVGLLVDEQDTIQGFTTLSVNPRGTGTETYNIVFSGDTIISPAYWGSMEFIRGGMHTAGRIVASDPSKKWYWFLMSKGHRTYLYLPLFFHTYLPDPAEQGSAALAGVLDQVARQMFGACWKPEKGLIIFPRSMGQLKPALAASTWQKQNKASVAYFLHRNPDFYLGHELACLAELKPDNMRGIAQRYFIAGTKHPVSWP
jgi:hypothetical protein